MAGVTRIDVRETAAELEALIEKQSHPKFKERLQVLYLLQLPDAMSISLMSKVIGRHRGSVRVVKTVSRRQTREPPEHWTKYRATKGNSSVSSPKSKKTVR
jgi:hypothetical protein